MPQRGHCVAVPSLCGHSQVVGTTVWLAFPEWTLELSQSCFVRGYLSDFFSLSPGERRGWCLRCSHFSVGFKAPSRSLEFSPLETVVILLVHSLSFSPSSFRESLS